MTVPMIGISHIDLSVTDRAASARWYSDVLGFEIGAEGRNERYGFPFTLVARRDAGVSMALIEHAQNPGDPFSEFRCGLDHLSFELPEGTDLDAWSRDLTARGYDVPPVGDDHGVPLIVLRDPDNIQIELYAGPLPELS